MDVHHHTHSSRKKWTHYFWEFIMLFLAVFCGFLAENQREHIVEGKRAKQYAKSLYNDLRVDTNEIRRGTDWGHFIISAIDSLVSMNALENRTGSVPGRFYFHSAFLYSSFIIDWSRSTLDQLIQSGSLRYFKNKELVDLINQYYYAENIINEQNHLDFIMRDKSVELRNHLLDSRYYAFYGNMEILREQHEIQITPTIDSLSALRLPLQKGWENEMDEFVNAILDRKRRLRLVVKNYYPWATGLAEKIMNLLEKEYHLK